MIGFGLIFEASESNLYTLPGFAFHSGMFSLSFWLHTRMLYNFIEADCWFSFFWTPPGQNHQKLLQNTACNSLKMSQNPSLTRGSPKKWKSTIGFDEVIKHPCVEPETQGKHAGVKCEAGKCVEVAFRCLKNHHRISHPGRKPILPRTLSQDTEFIRNLENNDVWDLTAPHKMIGNISFDGISIKYESFKNLSFSCFGFWDIFRFKIHGF